MEKLARETMEKVLKETTEEKVGLGIGVIGLGNAGGQNAAAAYAAGFPVVVFNTSEKDVSDAVLNSDINSIIIGDGLGAAKDRSISKGFLIKSLETVMTYDEVKDVVDRNQIIVLVSSLGGGSGSGFVSILANRISSKGKTVIIYSIAPKANEAGQAHFNKIEVLNEFNKLKLPFTILDLHQLEDVPNAEAYRKVQEVFVKELQLLRGDFSGTTEDGMLDEREILALFNGRGYFTISMVENLNQRDLDKASIQSKLIDNLETGNIHVPIERDKNIRYAGVIANVSKDINDATKAGDYSELFAHVGRPADTFSNYAMTDHNTANLYMILTGLTLPSSTIDLSTEVIAEYEKSSLGKKDVDLTATLGEVSFFKSSFEKDKDKLLCAEGEESTEIPDFLL